MNSVMKGRKRGRENETLPYLNPLRHSVHAYDSIREEQAVYYKCQRKTKTKMRENKRDSNSDHLQFAKGSEHVSCWLIMQRETAKMCFIIIMLMTMTANAPCTTT